MSDLDSSYVIRYENPDGDPVYVVENAEGLIEFSNLTDGLDCLAAISSLSNGELGKYYILLTKHFLSFFAK
jgi:hypothetical protein